MSDERRRRSGGSQEGGSNNAPMTSQVFNLMSPYKILVPKEEYMGQTFPIIIFAQPKALNYDEIVNVFIMAPSDTVTGTALIWFSDINRNIHVSSIANEDFNILKDDRIKSIGIGDVELFRKKDGGYDITECVKSVVVRNIYLRSSI